MGNASVGFTDLADLMRVPATMLSEFEDQGQFQDLRSDLITASKTSSATASSCIELLDQVAIVAANNATVLLHGETETGKEPNSRAILKVRRRRHRNFVCMNCAADPWGLLESDIFGIVSNISRQMVKRIKSIADDAMEFLTRNA